MSASARVREALHRGPSETSWRGLTQGLTALSERQRGLVSLAERSAASWPSALRVAPPRWWLSTPPGFSLARSLRIHTRGIAQHAQDRPELRQLRHLDVRLAALGPDGSSFFASRRLQGLEELSMVGPAMPGFRAEDVWEGATFAKLRSLTMEQVALEPAPARRLPRRVVQGLSVLRLRGVPLGPESIEHLCRALAPEHPSVLEVAGTRLEDALGAKLAASPVFGRLSELHLDGAGPRTLRALMFSLVPDGLLALGLGGAPAEGVAELIKLQLPVLAELRLRGVGGRLPGVHSGTLPALRALDLADARLDPSAPWVADGRLLADLEALDCGGCMGTGEVAARIAHGTMPNLSFLRASDLGGDGLVRLSAAAPNLRVIEVDGASIGIAAWATALHRRTIRALDVGASTGDDLACLLAERFEAPAMERLGIDGRAFGPRAWSSLGAMNLRDLSLRDAMLDEDAARRLSALRPYNLQFKGCALGVGALDVLAQAGAFEHLVTARLPDVCVDDLSVVAEAAPWLESVIVEGPEPDAAETLRGQHPLVRWSFVGGRGAP